MQVILKLLLCAATALWLVPAASAAPGDALSRAMEAVRAGDWDSAERLAAGDGSLAVDVVVWHRLRAEAGTAAQAMDFLARNSDWPGMPYLRQQSEPAFETADAATVRAFFAGQSPSTGTGALALARALEAVGNARAAEDQIVLAWRTLRLDSDERAAFLDQWGDILAPHHTARLDWALWNGWTVDAGAMLPHVDAGWRRLAEARLGLRNDASGVDAMIAAVPAALQDDPGLAYERMAWRLRKGRFESAAKMMTQRSSSAVSLGEPWAWARARRALARDAMRDGKMYQAYQIAATHWLSEGSDFADLEWLSGFIALRFLDRPQQALAHFRAHDGAVMTPISQGRAGYWQGRALEAMGDPTAAAAAYAAGARYQTSFYGLLAAERGGIPSDPALAGSERFPDWRTAPFTRTSVFGAAMLLLAAGEDTLGERFLTHMVESLDRTQIGQMGAMLEELGRPHVQVMLGKRAAQYGLELPGPYFAVHPRVAAAEYPVPRELVLAIARRESEFDPRVISPAGARGFMQLMPGTASDVSRDLGLDYDRARLLSDPVYNTTLGAEYLAQMAARFDGNVVMTAAAYNAGPSRPDSWMARFGDPRTGQVDIIDWIEFIPFDETRNYVMRVAESLPVYRARLGLPPHPVPFSEELRGGTIR
jgi:soluble lytic murein transglycosylase